MRFKSYLLEQIQMHRAMQPQDIVKLCYQAAYGAEHLISDSGSAKATLEKELGDVPAAPSAMYEMISDDFGRINLAAWKYKGLPVEWLFTMFMASAAPRADGDLRMEEYLNIVEGMRRNLPFAADSWTEYLESYEKQGMPAVRHSMIYREQERPAYRIVNSRFIRLLPVLEKAAQHNVQGRPCLIAIDGRAASGKTTMAEALALVLNADVVHMDDFFLPRELRSTERLAETGGNVHYERFIKEVLPYIRSTEVFSYRVFSCDNMDYSGSRIIGSKEFRIIEGSYSHHPKFENYADIRVFLDVDGDEQIARIKERNGIGLAKRFENEWIPMEEAYFETYRIKEKSDIVL